MLRSSKPFLPFDLYRFESSQRVIFQIELEFFSVSLCYVLLFNETVRFFSTSKRQSIRVGKDIHKCKHVIPFKIDAFFCPKHQPIPQKANEMQRENTNEKSKSRAKRDWREQNWLLTGLQQLKGTAATKSRAANITMPRMESEVKSNSKWARRNTDNKKIEWWKTVCLESSYVSNRLKIDEWHLRDKMFVSFPSFSLLAKSNTISRLKLSLCDCFLHNLFGLLHSPGLMI